MVNRYLLVKGKAGLGNRLLCALSSMLYAELTERKLYIDWTDGLFRGLDGKNGFSQLFDAPQLANTEPIWDSGSVTPMAWRGNMRKSVDQLMDEEEKGAPEADADPTVAARYTINVGRLEYQEQVAVRWAWDAELWRLRPHLKGQYAQWAGLSDEEILHRLARSFVFAPNVRDRAEEIRRRDFGPVTIGMHIRHTDRKNSYAKYPEIAERIMRDQPDAEVFLATDNKAVEDDLRTRYRRLIVTPKWFAQPGTPLHRTGSCPDPLERSVDALVEMYLLSRCDYLIYNSTSTFGIMARLFSQTPQGKVWDTAPRIQLELRKLRQRIRGFLGASN